MVSVMDQNRMGACEHTASFNQTEGVCFLLEMKNPKSAAIILVLFDSKIKMLSFRNVHRDISTNQLTSLPLGVFSGLVALTSL